MSIRVGLDLLLEAALKKRADAAGLSVEDYLRRLAERDLLTDSHDQSVDEIASTTIESKQVSQPYQKRPARHGSSYTIFGETKNRKEWAADPRCEIGYGMLKKRIRNGEPIEQAVKRKRFQKVRQPKTR